MNNKNCVELIVGPTASGKSARGLKIAETQDINIINGDSQQVYKGIEVISAQPTDDEKAQVPHKLYAFRPITEPFSAADWRRAAIREIEEAQQENRQPVIIGGSGFYIHALVKGLSPIPDVSEAIRTAAEHQYDKIGPDEFHQRLQEIDPVVSKSIHPNDRQRSVRAMEVYLASKKPLSYWQKQPLVAPPEDMSFNVTVLLPERDALYQRIDDRFDIMLENGALDEAKALFRKDFDPNLPGLKACGLPPLFRYFSDKIALEEAVEQAKQDSRNYAKRQYTWFRNQLPAGQLSDQVTVTHVTD